MSETLVMSRPCAGTGLGRDGLGRKDNCHARLGRPVNGSCTCALAFFCAGRYYRVRFGQRILLFCEMRHLSALPYPFCAFGESGSRRIAGRMMRRRRLGRLRFVCRRGALSILTDGVFPSDRKGAALRSAAPFAVHYRSAYAFAGSFSAITQRVVPKMLRLRCPAT